MTWGIVAVAGATVVGGVMASNAASDAADAQSASAQAGIDQQNRRFAEVQKLLSPYVSASTGSGEYTRGSLISQQDLLGLNGAEAQQAAISGISGSPLFAEMQKQGENAILQNASATGGLRGGNTQGALAQFRPQLLNQLIDQQYQRLGGITSLGQNAAAGVGNAGMATGNQITGLLGQQGAAQAGASLASGRVNTQMVNGLASGFGQYASNGGFGGNTAPAVDAPTNVIF